MLALLTFCVYFPFKLVSITPQALYGGLEVLSGSQLLFIETTAQVLDLLPILSEMSSICCFCVSSELSVDSKIPISPGFPLYASPLKTRNLVASSESELLDKRKDDPRKC